MSKITRQPVLQRKQSGEEAQLVAAADTIAELHGHEGRSEGPNTAQNKAKIFADLHKHFYVDKHEHDYTVDIPRTSGGGSWKVTVTKPGAIGAHDVSFEEVLPGGQKSNYKKVAEEVKGGVLQRGPRPALLSNKEIIKTLQSGGVVVNPENYSRTRLSRLDTQRAKMRLADYHKKSGIGIMTLVHGDNVKRFSTTPGHQHYIGKYLSQLGIQLKDHEATIRGLRGTYGKGERKKENGIRYQTKEDSLIKKLVHSPEISGMSMKDVIEHHKMADITEGINYWIRNKLRQRGIGL